MQNVNSENSKFGHFLRNVQFPSDAKKKNFTFKGFFSVFQTAMIVKQLNYKIKLMETAYFFQPLLEESSTENFITIKDIHPTTFNLIQ